MNKILLSVLIYFATTSMIKAQDGSTRESFRHSIMGISGQIYPAGTIATVDSEFPWSDHSSWLVRLGVNLADRKDFSKVNDNEKGAGFGGSVGYRKNFNLRKGRIIAGINTDLWNLWIKWKNEIGLVNQTQGRTYTLVLQPWIETGYFTTPQKSRFSVGLTAGFGREINIITKGREVAQGWILSGLIHINYLIQKKDSGNN